mgnify:CR=1 FL=1
MSVFPNPSNGSITLNLNSSVNGAVDIQVFDLLGKSVFLHSSQTTAFNFQETLEINAEPGTYLVRVIDELGNQQTKKLVIKSHTSQLLGKSIPF